MGKPKIYGKIRIPVCRIVFVCLLLFCESCSPEQEELWDVVPPDGTELPENLLHLTYTRCGLKQRFTVNLKRGKSNCGTKMSVRSVW